MSKLITLEGLPDGIAKSFKESVEPMDVITGAAVQGVFGPTIYGKLWNPDTGFLKMLTVPKGGTTAHPDTTVTSAGMLSDTDDAGAAKPNSVYFKKALSALLLAVVAFVAQKGSKRARGHVVGVIGFGIVDAAGAKVREMLPVSLQGLVEFNQYSMLTQDSAYGILTADSQYGETTAHDMAAFQAESENMMESDPEAEYA